MLSQMKFKILAPLVFVVLGGCFLASQSCQKDPPLFSDSDQDFKSTWIFNGVNIEAPANQVSDQVFEPISELGANTVALIPFGIVWQGSDSIKYDMDLGWWGETTPGIIQMAHAARSYNQKIMLKPQIWFAGSGAFTGTYDAGSEPAWQTFENSYLVYILHFAKLAEEEQFDLFCIGTEFARFVSERPAFWSSLIDSVRAHYSGKITYAENWDAYQDVPFWGDVDYIGIDAYFLLSDQKTPSVEALKTAWQPIAKDIKTLSIQHNTPVLFTEYGYRSIDYAAKTPWDSQLAESYNAQSQANGYRAVFETFNNQEWFAGAFFWKWHVSGNHGGEGDTKFTPQGKPVLEEIEGFFVN